MGKDGQDREGLQHEKENILVFIFSHGKNEEISLWLMLLVMEQGCCSVESARLTPLCPKFHCWTACCMVLYPSMRGFSMGTLVSPFLKKRGINMIMFNFS